MLASIGTESPRLESFACPAQRYRRTTVDPKIMQFCPVNGETKPRWCCCCCKTRYQMTQADVLKQHLELRLAKYYEYEQAVKEGRLQEIIDAAEAKAAAEAAEAEEEQRKRAARNPQASPHAEMWAEAMPEARLLEYGDKSGPPEGKEPQILGAGVVFDPDDPDDGGIDISTPVKEKKAKKEKKDKSQSGEKKKKSDKKKKKDKSGKRDSRGESGGEREALVLDTTTELQDENLYE